MIADIDLGALRRGRELYGFDTLHLDESARLPVPNNHFDIVFCSSVIEHVTVDKRDVEMMQGGHTFRQAAIERQQLLAQEIRRVSKRYYVQTPNRYFVVENHTWLPGFVVLFPRPLLLRTIRMMNKWWPKHTSADWNLLTARDMRSLFPEARILRERSFGLTKSLIAIKE